MCLVAQSCPTLCNPTDCSLPGSSVPGDSPGKNTGMGCHALLQGILPSQGSNPCLPHWRQILYRLSHQGNPYVTVKQINNTVAGRGEMETLLYTPCEVMYCYLKGEYYKSKIYIINSKATTDWLVQSQVPTYNNSRDKIAHKIYSVIQKGHRNRRN